MDNVVSGFDKFFTDPIATAETNDVLREDFLEDYLVWESEQLARGLHLDVERRSNSERLELRRLIYSKRWEREDPVIQLSAGSSLEVTHRVRVGLNMERTQTLAKALGMRIGGSVAEIGSHLEQQLEVRLEISSEEERTKALSLTPGIRPRRFAIWDIAHQVKVEALDIVTDPFGTVRSRWLPRGQVEFVANSNAVTITSDDTSLEFTGSQQITEDQTERPLQEDDAIQPWKWKWVNEAPFMDD